MGETTARFRWADATDWDAIWAIIRVVVATGETYPYPCGGRIFGRVG